MNKVVEVKNLCKNYDDFALEDVSFDIPKGYITGFIGPNGSGKTTTIKSILNIIRYDSGNVKIFGEDNSNRASPINEQIGVVMDSPPFADDWTISDVEAAVSPFYQYWDSRMFGGLLKKYNISKKKKVKELSRGMKVKLAIAVALSHGAHLLILDEPTSGLDPVARDELCDMLRDFVSDENKSVLFSTHITADLEKTADYITFILGGRIVFSGTKDELFDKYVLVKGGLQDVSPEQKKLIIGIREYGTGFEGMADSGNIDRLPRDLLFEPITIDEIIVFFFKGANVNE